MQIRVFCRVRPSSSSVVTCLSDGAGVRVAGGEASSQGTFTFDKVFGADSSQQEVFGEVAELVQSALDGYQVSLRAFSDQSESSETAHICFLHVQQGSFNKPLVCVTNHLLQFVSVGLYGALILSRDGLLPSKMSFRITLLRIIAEPS